MVQVEDGATPMTYEETLQLVKDINSLSGDQLDGIVNILKTNEPTLDNPDQLEVDFETLKASTLRDLEAYVASCFAKENEEP